MKVVCWLGGFHLLISFLERIRKVMENCNFRIISSCVQLYYSCTYVVRQYVCSSIRSPFPGTICTGPIIFQLISPVTFIEQLSTTMLKGNIYVIQVAEMMCSFQMKYRSMLMQVTFRSYGPQWSKLNKTKTQN